MSSDEPPTTKGGGRRRVRGTGPRHAPARPRGVDAAGDRRRGRRHCRRAGPAVRLEARDVAGARPPRVCYRRHRSGAACPANDITTGIAAGRHGGLRAARRLAARRSSKSCVSAQRPRRSDPASSSAADVASRARALREARRRRGRRWQSPRGYRRRCAGPGDRDHAWRVVPGVDVVPGRLRGGLAAQGPRRDDPALSEPQRTRETEMKRPLCVIGAADHAAWAYMLCVAAQGDVPAVVERRRVTLIDAGLPTMPYHHESLGLPEDKANALIARVRRSIAEHAARALSRIVADVSPSYSVVALAARRLQFAELPETIGPVRQSYQLQCAADGMMYQLALCAAARALGLEVRLFRRGEEAARAAAQLEVRVEDVESFVNGAGRPPGPPWTQEHRRAYAAGIAVLAERAPRRLDIRRR